MTLIFTKMHGLGNDFVILDSRQNPALLAAPLTEAEIVALCDRRLGIGCDQLVLLTPPADKMAGGDIFVRFFNPDGSEAGACGNASRCVAALMGGTPVLQTCAGLLPTREIESEQGQRFIEVEMGIPKFGWQDIPLAQPVDSLHLPLHDAAACSMGNPHATLFLPIREAENLGPELEKDALFPERANIGFAEILSPHHMRLRVWERGAGLTLACGSGACAALVNAVRRGLVGRQCRITMEKGDLFVHWREEDDMVILSGPATKVFEGRMERKIITSKS